MQIGNKYVLLQITYAHHFQKPVGSPAKYERSSWHALRAMHACNSRKAHSLGLTIGKLCNTVGLQKALVGVSVTTADELAEKGLPGLPRKRKGTPLPALFVAPCLRAQKRAFLAALLLQP